jgi:hypothetical protein
MIPDLLKDLPNYSCRVDVGFHFSFFIVNCTYL